MISYTTQQDVLTVTIFGEIDHHSAAELRRQIDRLIQKELPRTLRLDFSQVDFCDSSGIAVVLGRYKLMASLGGQVRLCNLSPAVKHIFALADLKKLITIEE